jgi:hypothetical protein
LSAPAQSFSQAAGPAPIYNAAVDFQFAECFQPAGGGQPAPRPALLTLKVPSTLTKRRFYAYLAMLESTDNEDNGNLFSADLLLNQCKVGSLPLQQGTLGVGDFVNGSLPCVTSAMWKPTSFAPNLLQVSLYKPLAGETGSPIFLYPFEFSAVIDTVNLNLDRFWNCVNLYRCIIAMVSTL